MLSRADFIDGREYKNRYGSNQALPLPERLELHHPHLKACLENPKSERHIAKRFPESLLPEQ